MMAEREDGREPIFYSVRGLPVGFSGSRLAGWEGDESNGRPENKDSVMLVNSEQAQVASNLSEELAPPFINLLPRNDCS